MRQFPESLIDSYEGEMEGRFYRWMSLESGPDDWHRFALDANWDFHDAAVFEWIAGQPACDKATALRLFWAASPEYDLEFPEDAQAHQGLVETIRDRWLAGGYGRSELAFDPEVDAYLPDFERLQSAFGARIDEALPPSMRQPLSGRRLDLDDVTEGIPSRFWQDETQ